MSYQALRRRVVGATPLLGLAFVFAIELTACVTTLGGDFDTQRLRALEPGRTDKARFLATIGETSDRSRLTLRHDGAGQLLAQPLDLEQLNYFYLDRAGRACGLEKEPHRLAWVMFDGDQLVGYSISSTFAADSTDFDADNVQQLRRGQSTQDDVLALFGPPSGRFIQPIALVPGGTRWMYRVQWTAEHQLHIKTLRVDFNAAHVVVDFDSSTSA